MRRDTTIKSATMVGASDLTIVAPIKKGLVPSLDAVTYKTRAERVLKTLHLGRTSAHEYELARVLSDAVERVGRIHSVRIAIIEPEDKLMLAVTFDGSWEAYIRVIWQKVSRSLDLIFCNTEGYVTGWDHSFEEWCDWLRQAQAQTPFLYSPPALTSQDTQYLRIHERRFRRDLAGADLATTRARIPAAEEIGEKLRDRGVDPSNLGMDERVNVVVAGRPAFRQGMKGLVGLYRLADWYLPGTADGDVLHRAAAELLREFLPLVTSDTSAGFETAIGFAEQRFKDALDWLRFTVPRSAQRVVPALPPVPDRSEYADVQGGIIEPYPGVSDGCLVLLAFDCAAALGDFLGCVGPTRATDVMGEGAIAVNVALTLEGLRLAGLGDQEVEALPQEFVQGMERRAGILGDLRVNHPRRWRRPALNGALGASAPEVSEDDPCARIELGSVHVVLQLRLLNSTLGERAAREVLWNRHGALEQAHRGMRTLGIQWMHRLKTADGQLVREHFGFLDSDSGPVLDAQQAGAKYPNRVNLGEILLGHPNAADRGWDRDDRQGVRPLLRNGAFLVVRKLRQDVGQLAAALDGAVPQLQGIEPGTDPAQHRALLMAKMMGRWPISSAQPGTPLANPATDQNDFTFQRDEDGRLCPFHAHIRRANPREVSGAAFEPPGARPPRLVRRSMSYGPLHDDALTGEAKAASLAAERGLVFMTYNASIGEQFEVVQRWLAGGNASGSYSGQSDPLLGVAEPGGPRCFRFEHEGNVVRMKLDGSPRVHDEPRPLVRLEWGMYLFTPSLTALGMLADRATGAADAFAKSWSAERGEAEIARLRRLEQDAGSPAAFDAWKAVLEDPTSAREFSAASVWAAIRERHGGVLRTPFGVLVASRDLVDHVLQDRARDLTVTGYLPRMQRSFGTLYLGLDAHTDGAYERESAAVNAAIMDLTADPAAFRRAVDEASRVTQAKIDDLALQAADRARADGELRWDVTFDVREVTDMVLAHFCEQWFGLSERGGHLHQSGMRWNWKAGQPPCYPGHFMAPSRYTFQPHPGTEVERIGAEHGLVLREALDAYLAEFGSQLTAPVARAVLDGAGRLDASYPARTLAGVLMGFLPTTDGNMRRVLDEWLNDGTYWSLRSEHGSAGAGDAAASQALAQRLHARFIAAMQLRAAPELLWRTAARGHVIGDGDHQVAVNPGDMVIASLISATQQCLEHGDPTVTHAFGGDRRAAGGRHPTHACPGYGPAMAVIEGFLAGMVQSRQSLRPGPGPLSLFMDGTVPPPRPSITGTAWIWGSDAGLLEARAETAIPLLAIGDSWQYEGWLGLFATLTTELQQLGYSPDATGSDLFCRNGKTLKTLATSDLQDLKSYVANLEGAQGAPGAILLSGGGNDLVQCAAAGDYRSTRLFGLLNAGASSADSALNEAAVKDFIDGELMSHYRAILGTLRAVSTMHIVLHGYDRPMPDGTKFVIPFILENGPWLAPVFDAARVTADLNERRKIMRTLINRLNAMIGRAAGEHQRVHHVGFAGVLEEQQGYAQNYRRYWANELHPTRDGFAILAGLVRDKLVALGLR